MIHLYLYCPGEVLFLMTPYFLSIRQGVENQCRDLGVDTTEIYRISDFQLSQINED